MFNFKEENGVGLCTREVIGERRLVGARQQEAFYVRVRTLEIQERFLGGRLAWLYQCFRKISLVIV